MTSEGTGSPFHRALLLEHLSVAQRVLGQLQRRGTGSGWATAQAHCFSLQKQVSTLVLIAKTGAHLCKLVTQVNSAPSSVSHGTWLSAVTLKGGQITFLLLPVNTNK